MIKHEEHIKWVAEQVDIQLLRLASAEVTVPRRYSVCTVPDRQFPTRCFAEACHYVVHHRIKGVVYVFGTSKGGAMGEHGWVELPGNIVFDGVLQRFYDMSQYYEIEDARPWYRFTRSAVCWLLEQHLPDWRWDVRLWLPWAKSAHDRSAEALVIDKYDAQKYLADARFRHMTEVC